MKGECGPNWYFVVSLLLRVWMASQKVLQIVLGLFAVIFNFRRPCYAVLHHIYGYTDSHGPGCKRIPRAIAEKLHAACFLVSCAVSNLSASPYLRLQATDATPIRAGACSALYQKLKFLLFHCLGPRTRVAIEYP